MHSITFPAINSMHSITFPAKTLKLKLKLKQNKKESQPRPPFFLPAILFLHFQQM